MHNDVTNYRELLAQIACQNLCINPLDLALCHIKWYLLLSVWCVKNKKNKKMLTEWKNMPEPLVTLMSLGEVELSVSLCFSVFACTALALTCSSQPRSIKCINNTST